MKMQTKRILSVAAAFCLLPNMISAAPLRYAVNAADAFSYSDSAVFDSIVRSIEEGNCGVYADSTLLQPVSLPLGSRLNTWQTYYVPTEYGVGWSGMQCYIYSQGVYTRLFGAMPGNGNADSTRTRTVLSGVWELTPEILISHQVMPGAYLRTTANGDLSFNGSYGHSLIILGYDENSITVLEGNADGAGLIEKTTMDYGAFNRRFTTGKGRGIAHVIQPDLSVYASMYGLSWDGAYVPPVETVTEPAETATETTTTETTTTETTTTETTTTETVTTESTTEYTTTELTTTEMTTSTTPVTTTAFYTESSEMFAEAGNQPVYFPLASPELYAWSSSDPQVAMIVWDGIAITGKAGVAVITARNGSAEYNYTLYVNGKNWAHLGDVNGDGTVDPADAVLVMNEYVNSVTGESTFQPMNSEQKTLADVDGNGVVDLVDAQLILQYYVNTTLTGTEMSAEEAWSQLL